MIWLASFPRSGNTFFRNILHEVYGIRSSEFHVVPDKRLDPKYKSYPVVKTHLLPQQVVPDDPDIPAVYLIRDGRDSVISLAHHRKDIVAPGSDFFTNLSDAIRAQEGTYFGGWGKHVEEWSKRASIIIKFEDLIKNPIECIERLRPILDMPEPDLDKLHTFADLRTKDVPYGGGLEDGLPPEDRALRRKLFFRKGKVGSWKDEFPKGQRHYYELLNLFWGMHGQTMKKFGYKRNIISYSRMWLSVISLQYKAALKRRIKRIHHRLIEK